MTTFTRPLGISIPDQQLSEETKALIKNPAIGMIYFFTSRDNNNYRDEQQFKQLVSDILTVRPDMLLGIDHEGINRANDTVREGVWRINNPEAFPEAPSQYQIGKIYRQDPAKGREAAYNAGKTITGPLTTLGIFTAAPVLDSHPDAQRPPYARPTASNVATVIDVPNHADTTAAQRSGSWVICGLGRSYGNIAAVTDCAQAFLQGVTDNKTRSTVKHFPNHGYAYNDTHVGQATDNRDKETILNETRQLWQPLIDSQMVEMIMPAHVIYPAVDSLPASLSEQWIKNILRTKLGFDGLVITDCCNMKAIHSTYPSYEAVWQTFEQTSGDILLYTHQPIEEMRALLERTTFQIHPDTQRRIENLATIRNSAMPTSTSIA